VVSRATLKFILRRVFFLVIGAIFVVVIEAGVSSLLEPYDWANADLSDNPVALLSVLGGIVGGVVFVWWLFSDE
tara:strand:+ start:276 stop:497 length:222 start_codon:yes stop_codon:yes gene_type:complete